MVESFKIQISGICGVEEMKKIKKFIINAFKEIKTLSDMLKRDDITAFAANSAYCFILSFIPIIMLLMALLKITNVSREFMETAFGIFLPKGLDEIIIGIIDDVYGNQAALISVTAVFALWWAGRGFMALKNGMRAVLHIDRCRNYFALRFRGSLDAMIFLAMIMAALFLGVFGENIEKAVMSRISLSGTALAVLVQFRKVIMIAMFMILFTILYKIIPDWKNSEIFADKKVSIFRLVPGAAVCAVCWQGYSYIMMLYLKYSASFLKMFGSLSVYIGLMLWLYGCMYFVFFGLETNVWLIDFSERYSMNKHKTSKKNNDCCKNDAEE